MSLANELIAGVPNEPRQRINQVSVSAHSPITYSLNVSNGRSY